MRIAIFCTQSYDANCLASVSVEVHGLVFLGARVTPETALLTAGGLH